MKRALLCSVLFVLAAAPSALAQRSAIDRLVEDFAKTMQSDSFQSFDPLRNGGELERWTDVRSFMERFRCISVDHHAIREIRVRDGQTIVDVDVYGHGFTRGKTNRRIALPAHWTLTLDATQAPRILGAEMTESTVVRELAAAAPHVPDREQVLGRGVDLILTARLLAYALADHAYRGKAEPLYAWTFAIAQQQQDLAVEAYCRALRATYLLMIGDATARAAAEEAVQMAERSGDAQATAAALFPLALIRRGTDGVDAALPVFYRTAGLLDWIDDPRAALKALYMASYLESVRGNFRAALAAAATLEREAREVGWSEGVTMAEFTLARAHAELGEEEAVQELALRMIRRSEADGDAALAATARIALAASFTRLGQYDQAEPVMRRLAPDLGRLEFWNQTTAYLDMASNALKARRFAEARHYLDLSTRYPDGTPAPFFEARLQVQSRIAFESGDFETALAVAADGLARNRVSDEGGGPYASAWPLEQFTARVLRRLGRCVEATEHLRQAVAIVEADMDQVVADEAGHLSYFDSRLDPYRELVEILFEQGQIEEAFAVSETMRVRRLRDLIARAGAPRFPALSASESAESKALESELAELNRSLLTAPEAEAPDVRARLVDTRRKLAAFELRMSVAHAEMPPSRLAPDLAKLAPPPAGHALIEYVVLPEHTIAFVLRTEGGQRVIEARDLRVSRKWLQSATERYVRAIQRIDYSVDESGDSLRTAVVDPLLTALDGVSHLHIVPDDVLWELPFDALRRPDQSYLVDRFVISYMPAHIVQAHRVSPARGRSLLAFGDPQFPADARPASLARLRDAEQEARAIGALYGPRAKVLTGAAATEAAFRANAASYSVIHIATHGLLENRTPLFSALLLARDGADDGLLEAREILRQRLTADLVVLSACESARGSIGRGEGIGGMAWATLASGASTVVVSQWSAESRSARDLMVDFHRRLLDGKSKSDALTLAKRRLKRDPDFAHPFFWASFIVVGDPR